MALTVFVLDSLTAIHRGEGVEHALLEDDGALALHNSIGTVLVDAIFPWGTDAVFNRLQVPRLLMEWRRVLADTKDLETSRNLHVVLEFVEHRVADEGEIYVVFTAD